MAWYDRTPQSSRAAQERTASADILKPGQTANPFASQNLAELTDPGDYYNDAATLGRGFAWHWNKNPDLQNAAGQFNQMSQGLLNGPDMSAYKAMEGKLANGPGNAFNAQQLAKMHALGNEQLMRDRQQTNQGIAGANAARGVAGNNIGALLNNQTAALNRGALAKGDLEAQIEGLKLGNTQYNSMTSAANTMGNAALGEYNARGDTARTLGTVATAQDQQAYDAQTLDFAKREDDRKRLYDDRVAADRARDEFLQQYAEMMTRSPTGGKKMDNITTGLRNYYTELIDEANRLQRRYVESA